MMDSTGYGLDPDVFLTSDDHLMVSDDFIGRNGKKTMLTLEDLQELVGRESPTDDVSSINKNDLDSRLVGSLNDALPISRHFMSSGESQDIQILSCSKSSTPKPNLVQEGEEEEDNPNYFVEHMEVRAPLITLRNMLQEKFSIDLSNHEIWLQNAQKLKPDKNLVEQCVQGAGLVQVNVEVIGVDGVPRINIVDVLKPTDEFLQKEEKVKVYSSYGVEWEEDREFRRESGLHIPKYVSDWSKDVVWTWLQWAVKKFGLVGLKASDWSITGKELAEMTIETFNSIVKNDPDSVFWTHLELLRKCNVVAVVSSRTKTKEVKKDPDPVESDKSLAQLPAETCVQVPTSSNKRPAADSPVKTALPQPKRSRVLGCKNIVTGSKPHLSRNITGVVGVNGQITLWQFLLELLTDIKYQSVIHFISSDGKFRLQDPEMVAKLWGIRKKKPSMSYEKLSRALRYYYDGDMIAKVPGQTFVYKFVCDLKELLGYSPAELYGLVTECAKKHNLPHLPPANFEGPG